MSTKNLPLVSIIIPVYNGSNYIKEAIDSALEQTYENIEIIVINDGSTDDGATEKIALSYGNKIKYFHKENGGVSSALNLGIQKMQGKYFSWLSHDDKYDCDKIKLQVEAVLNDENVICICNSAQIDKDSKLLKKEKRLFSHPMISWDEMLQYLLRKGTINGCSLLIPKKIFEECGTFDETLRFNQDALMWMQFCIHHFSFYYIENTTAYIRIHNGQLTQKRQDLFHSDCLKMSQFLIPEIIKVSSKKRNFLYYYACYNAKYNNKKVVRSCIKEGKKHNLLPLAKRIKLSFISFYGLIRPMIKKIYYLLFKHVKTN